MKMKIKKYSIGVSQIAYPQSQNVGTATGTGALQGAATGATVGATFGPWGAVIGGVAGGIGGGVAGNLSAKENNLKATSGQQMSGYINKMNQGNQVAANYIAGGTPGNMVQNENYGDGTNKIRIKPSKKGTFTKAATEHGESVQGFASQVLNHKENYSPAMVKKANFAHNAAGWKKEDGSSSTNKKQVEIEGGEDVYRKSGNKFILKKTAIGPSHAEGGIPYTAEEGDIIIPKNKSLNFYKHYVKGDHAKMEELRRKLPADKPDNKYKLGANEIDPSIGNTSLGMPSVDIPIDTGQSLSNESLGMPSVSVPIQSSQEDSQDNGLDIPEGDGRSYPGGNTPPSSDLTPTTGMQKVQGAIGTATALAPTIYNTVRGFSQPQTMQYYQYQPKLQNAYVDVSNQLNDVKRGVTAASDSINNFAGGNANTYLNNMNALRLGAIGETNNVNQYKSDREREIQQGNINSLNDAQQANLQNKFNIDDINLQAQARQKDFQAAAATGISDYSQMKQNQATQQQNIQAYNKFVTPYTGTQNYDPNVTYDANGYPVSNSNVNTNTRSSYNRPLFMGGNNAYKKGTSSIEAGNAPKLSGATKYKLKIKM